MGDSIRGACLCGAVRYECMAEPVFSLNCHCLDCQRASGSAYLPVLMVPAVAALVWPERLGPYAVLLFLVFDPLRKRAQVALDRKFRQGAYDPAQLVTDVVAADEPTGRKSLESVDGSVWYSGLASRITRYWLA